VKKTVDNNLDRTTNLLIPGINYSNIIDNSVNQTLQTQGGLLNDTGNTHDDVILDTGIETNKVYEDDMGKTPSGSSNTKKYKKTSKKDKYAAKELETDLSS
jgi:hypothetical protein